MSWGQSGVERVLYVTLDLRWTWCQSLREGGRRGRWRVGARWELSEGGREGGQGEGGEGGREAAREAGQREGGVREGGSEGGRTERRGRLSNVPTENVHTHKETSFIHIWIVYTSIYTLCPQMLID